MGDPSRENVRLGFYFADLIFVVCQSTAKTAKIGSLENFRLYGRCFIYMYIHVPRVLLHVLDTSSLQATKIVQNILHVLRFLIR